MNHKSLTHNTIRRPKPLEVVKYRTRSTKIDEQLSQFLEGAEPVKLKTIDSTQVNVQQADNVSDMLLHHVGQQGPGRIEQDAILITVLNSGQSVDFNR